MFCVQLVMYCSCHKTGIVREVHVCETFQCGSIFEFFLNDHYISDLIIYWNTVMFYYVYKLSVIKIGAL